MTHSSVCKQCTLCTYFLLVVTDSLFSQIKIHGLITDPVSKPLYNASVVLLNATDSSLVKGNMTDNDGRYAFSNVTSGSYIISATFIGYHQVYSPSFAATKNE